MIYIKVFFNLNISQEKIVILRMDTRESFYFHPLKMTIYQPYVSNMFVMSIQF